jgi:hypothetical protein
MRILIRTSKWAVWARRVGALALPLAALPVWFHREHFITSENFLTVEMVAVALAALAVVMALIAFARLWVTGDQGWWKATLAFVFGSLCLAPAAYFGWLATTVPSSFDVTTDFVNPPSLVSTVEARLGPDERARIEAAYPNARSRNYPIAAPAMFDTVEELVDARGWDVRARRAPQTDLDGGQINAVVTTLLGFREEVAVRVTGSSDGATVAVRSASLAPFPDFGENGKRVESFLLDLDTRVTQMLRNATPTATD